MATIPSFPVEKQRTEWDCGIVALAMLTGTPYEEVLAASARVTSCERGLYLHEIEKTADVLGVQLKRRRRNTYDPDTATGILHVYNLKRALYHVVILWEGVVIDNGKVWQELDVYLATEGYKAGSLLTRDD